METTENLNKAAITNGIIIGIISSAIGILTYYVAPAQLGSVAYGIGIMLFSLALYIFFTIDLRKKVGGYWSFKDAFKGIFLMAFIAGLIGIAVNYVFYKFLEPDAFQKISGYVSEGLSSTFEKLGMDQGKIDEEIEKSLERMKSQYDPSLMDILKNLGIALLIQVVLSLIFAAIFKKEKPLFSNKLQEE